MKWVFGGGCQWPGCETTERLEFAHVKKNGVSGRGRGSYERIKDVLLHRENYKQFCHEHHREFDSHALLGETNPGA